MVKLRERSSRYKKTFAGKGGFVSTVINKAIDLLPFEAHVPGYSWCGPGTNVEKRLARGDKGVNPLDEACKLHDIEYSKHKDSENRRRADKELADRAWARVKSSDASFGERATALAVSAAMKAKTALGSGKKRNKAAKKCKNAPCRSGKGLYLRPYKGSGKVKGKKKKLPINKKKR